MTAIYAVCCLPLQQQEALNAALCRLSDRRQQKTLRLLSAQKRAQSAAAGLLVTHLFDGEDVSYDKCGRPYIAQKPEQHISISHTGNWVFCAVADSPIGLDAQIITPCRPAVADRLFSLHERTVATTDDEFTRIWTCKEAFFKLRGNVPIEVLKTTDFSNYNDSLDPITQCYYRCYRLENDIFVTVCSEQYNALPNCITEIALSDM